MGSKKLYSNAILYLISNGLNAAVPFVLIPVLTRFLYPTSYGEIALYQTSIVAMTVFIGLGLSGSIPKRYVEASSNEEIERYVISCLQVVMISFFIVFIIALTIYFATSYFDFSNCTIFVCALLTAGSLGVTQIILVLIQMQKNAKRFAIIQISQGVINILLTLLLVIAMNLQSNGRVLAITISSVIAALLSIDELRRHIPLKQILIVNPKELRYALNFGLWIMPYAAGGFFLGSLDKWVIIEKLGMYEAGVYYAIFQVMNCLPIFYDAMNKTYMPWLFEKLSDSNHLSKIKIIKVTYFLIASIFAITLTVALLIPYFARYFVGEKYESGLNLILPFAIAHGFGALYTLFTNYLFFQNKTGTLSVLTIVSGLASFVMLFSFVPVYGIYGAAVIYAVSMCFLFTLTFSVANRNYPMPWLLGSRF